MDPYERADIVSNQYDDWRVKNAYLMGSVEDIPRCGVPGHFRRVPTKPGASKLYNDQIEKDIDRGRLMNWPRVPATK